MTLKRRQQLTGTLTGMAVTGLCILYFFVIDTEQKLELQAVDLRIRHFNRLRPTTPIVHLDIDDNSLARVGRWPWRRQQTAELLRALEELGPAHVMIDLQLSEAERPYDDDPRLDEESDVGLSAGVVGERSEENRVYGDLELADAIRSGGNVVMATHFEELYAPQQADPWAARLRAWWPDHKGATLDEALAALGLTESRAAREAVNRELLRLRVRDELLNRFTLTGEELAERLHTTEAEIGTVIAGVKSAVAQELVARDTSDGQMAGEALAKILGPERGRLTADREDVIAALRLQRGLSALDRSTNALEADTAAGLHRARRPTPPISVLGRAAKMIASVNFVADVDGAVRRVPILVNYEGRALAHMGLAAAAEIMGLEIGRATYSDGVLTIPRKSGEVVRMPLDDDGNLIIPWTATAKEWRTGGDFPHISAAKLWALADAKRLIRENEKAINYKLAEVIAVSKGQYQIITTSGPAEKTQVVHADNPYRERVNEQLALARRARLARLRQSESVIRIEELERQAGELLAQIRKEQALAISTVELTCEDIDRTSAAEIAADPEAVADAKRYKEAMRIVKEDVAQLRRANEGLAREIAALKAELGPLLKDKYVFVGFAATAQGDIVITPIDRQTNGVMCHAQVLNAILQEHFITPPSAALGILLSLLAGAVVSVLTSASSPRTALLATLGLLVAYVLVNGYLLFMGWNWWVMLIAPTVTICVAWAFVTLFRQLTAERDRRLFARELGQYTSPIIAARIAESPEAAQAFKTVQTRDVTCFFSDLRGFTTMTEEQDPEVTQHVLNTYLQRMSQAIWARRGLINKFMGDGIMAFFNPSVDPLPEHVRAACDTALEAMEELEKLKVERRTDPATKIFDVLHMRIGLASGLCKNGDMGSELKTDYTVIGDVVNLAARLEPANKVFGTQILVSGPTREAVGDLYEFRYLAELQVKGKGRTVPVYEMVGRKGSLSAEQQEYIERFEAGVELYKQRRWDECIVHFTRILSKRFDDAGASRYIDACQEFKAFPPEEGWAGALELKEK